VPSGPLGGLGPGRRQVRDPQPGDGASEVGILAAPRDLHFFRPTGMMPADPTSLHVQSPNVTDMALPKRLQVRYLRDHCCVFAAGLHRVFGWRVAAVFDAREGFAHAVAIRPDDVLVDASGPTTRQAITERYELADEQVELVLPETLEFLEGYSARELARAEAVVREHHALFEGRSALGGAPAPAFDAADRGSVEGAAPAQGRYSANSAETTEPPLVVGRTRPSGRPIYVASRIGLKPKDRKGAARPHSTPNGYPSAPDWGSSGSRRRQSSSVNRDLAIALPPRAKIRRTQEPIPMSFRHRFLSKKSL